MMTYEEIVLQVRQAYEDADAREIFEHVAIQVNIEGEGAGAFYIEVANREICVEPYDYVDRDGLFTATGQVLLDIAQNRISAQEAYDTGLLKIEGNKEKLVLLKKVKQKRTKKNVKK